MANGGWRKGSEPVRSIGVYLRLSAANKAGYGVSIHDSPFTIHGPGPLTTHDSRVWAGISIRRETLRL